MLMTDGIARRLVPVLFGVCLTLVQPDVCASVRSADFEWAPLSVGSAVPSNAVIGGIISMNETAPPLLVYVVRAKLEGRYHIGKFYNPTVVHEWKAYILGDNGSENVLANQALEILVMTVPDQLRWVPSSGGVIPKHAVHFSNENGLRRYLCRGIFRGRPEFAEVVIPGEAKLDQGWCLTYWYVPGVHIEYQVLVKLEDLTC